MPLRRAAAARINRLVGPVLRPVLFVLCLVPLVRAVLALFGMAGSLGANPVEELLNRAGIWGLNLLLATLAVTPLRELTGAQALGRLRRMLGLFAFFYLCLHLTVYVTLDRALELGTIAEDIMKRPFITLGVTAFLALLPLAATSTDGMRRRLGRRWQQLHRLVYAIAILGVGHYFWQVKQDVRNPALYAGVLALLLGYRLARWWRHRRARRQAQAAPGAAQALRREA
jgi:sulfoxide reductase heme-binding subunit YedZ